MQQIKQMWHKIKCILQRYRRDKPNLWLVFGAPDCEPMQWCQAISGGLPQEISGLQAYGYGYKIMGKTLFALKPLTENDASGVTHNAWSLGLDIQNTTVESIWLRLLRAVNGQQQRQLAGAIWLLSLADFNQQNVRQTHWTLLQMKQQLQQLAQQSQVDAPFYIVIQDFVRLSGLRFFLNHNLTSGDTGLWGLYLSQTKHNACIDALTQALKTWHKALRSRIGERLLTASDLKQGCHLFNLGQQIEVFKSKLIAYLSEIFISGECTIQGLFFYHHPKLSGKAEDFSAQQFSQYFGIDLVDKTPILPLQANDNHPWRGDLNWLHQGFKAKVTTGSIKKWHDRMQKSVLVLCSLFVLVSVTHQYITTRTTLAHITKILVQTQTMPSLVSAQTSSLHTLLPWIWSLYKMVSASQTLKSVYWLQPSQQLQRHVQVLFDEALQKWWLPRVGIDLTTNANDPGAVLYRLIKIEAQQVPVADFDLRQIAPVQFAQVFNLMKPTKIVPGFYTITGYQQIFIPWAQKFSQLLSAHQNSRFNSVTPRVLYNQALQLYLQDIKLHWQQSVASLQPRALPTIPIAIKVFADLTQHPSPWQVLLNAVAKKDMAEGSISHFDLPVNTTKTLRAMQHYWLQLSVSPDPARMAFRSLVAAMQQDNGQFPIQKLLQIASLAQEPLKYWLQALAEQNAKLLLKEANIYLNKSWQTMVRAPLQQASLLARYPLDPNAHQAMRFAQFQQLFAANSRLNQFINTHLMPLINSHQTPWQWYPLVGQVLPISATRLAQLQSFIVGVHALTQMVNNGLLFTLTPRTLDPKMASMMLYSGSQKMAYRHGPQLAKTFTWNRGNSSPVVLQMRNMQGKLMTCRYQGRFAWLRFFAAAQIFHNYGQPGQTMLIVTCHHREASFIVTHTSTSPVAALDALNMVRSGLLVTQWG